MKNENLKYKMSRYWLLWLILPVMLWAIPITSGRQQDFFEELKDSLQNSTRSDYKVSIYEQYTNLYPQISLGWELLRQVGQAYQQEGNYTKAAEYLEKALKIYTSMEKYIKIDTRKLDDMQYDLKIAKGFADIESKALFKGKSPFDPYWRTLFPANILDDNSQEIICISDQPKLTGYTIKLYKLQKDQIIQFYESKIDITNNLSVLRVYDINGDGYDEIIYIYNCDFVVLQYNRYTNEFDRKIIKHNRDLAQIVIGDIDNDNKNEIAVAERQTIAPYDSTSNMPQEIYEACVPYELVLYRFDDKLEKIIYENKTGCSVGCETYVMPPEQLVGVLDFFNEKHNVLVVRQVQSDASPSRYNIIDWNDFDRVYPVDFDEDLMYNKHYYPIWPICEFDFFKYNDITYLIGNSEKYPSNYCSIMKYNGKTFDDLYSLREGGFFIVNARDSVGLMVLIDKNYYFVPLDRIIE